MPKNITKTLAPHYYYDERGNMVFTAAYHLDRGYCCKNGCKHCPYDNIIEEKDLHKGK